MSQTVAALLEDAFRVNSSAPAQRFLRSGEWCTRSYGEVRALAAAAAQVLRDRGVTAGDRVALLLRTRADWTVIEIAAAMAGATLVPFYPSSTKPQLVELLELAGPVLLIAEAGGELPHAAVDLPLGVVEVGEHDGDLGDLADAECRDVVWAATEPDDVFTIAFSSGSTGRPKGCVVLQRNYAAVLEMVRLAERHPRSGHAHRIAAFIYLPLAHASARLQQLTSLIVGGEIVYGVGGTAEILGQIETTAPSYVAGVPRLFEYAAAKYAGSPEQLRQVFGQNLAYALSGGAPLPVDVLEAYESAEVLIVDGYGLTESSTAVAIGTPHCMRAGSVGKPLPGLEVVIAVDGEVLVRGENVFAGYLDDDAATREVLANGWLHTGDLGHLDADGFLFITGRKKNVIVTSTGKNISPEGYENKYRAATGISDFVLVGDSWPYVIAVAAASDDGAPGEDVLVSAARRLNQGLAPQERVRKIVLLDRELSRDLGELTASGKVIRSAVERNHRELIQQVYANCTELPVLHIDGPSAPSLPTDSSRKPATQGV